MRGDDHTRRRRFSAMITARRCTTAVVVQYYYGDKSSTTEHRSVPDFFFLLPSGAKVGCALFETRRGRQREDATAARVVTSSEPNQASVTRDEVAPGGKPRKVHTLTAHAPSTQAAIFDIFCSLMPLRSATNSVAISFAAIALSISFTSSSTSMTGACSCFPLRTFVFE